MVQLTAKEAETLGSQNATLKKEVADTASTHDRAPCEIDWIEIAAGSILVSSRRHGPLGPKQ
jgi:hypothetical protein